MGRVVVSEFISVDGVTEAPGGEPGYRHTDWVSRFPDEGQFRQIWQLVCKGKRVDYDERGVEYLIEKWYRRMNRPFRMCQPRDILDQMMSMAKYNMERVNFSPDLIDAACETYFISNETKNFGVRVSM